jgi:hypothetical protein
MSSANKSTILKSFNKLFFDFLDDVLTIYPENKEIKYAKSQFEFINRGNPTIIVKFWKKYVYDPYQAQIDAGNIQFFIEKDYRTDFENSHGEADSYKKILDMIENVKSIVRDMDDTNRAHATEYIVNLSKLSVVYTGFV